jgi:hypothetical protein
MIAIKVDLRDPLSSINFKDLEATDNGPVPAPIEISSRKNADLLPAFRDHLPRAFGSDD